MNLTPTERDRLLLFLTAELARSRRSRGLLLNVPEATALIADTVCEAARDGMRIADAVAVGRSVLKLDEVLPGVPAVVQDVRVEAVFEDGTRLVVVPDPFGAAAGPDDPGAIVARGPSPAVVHDDVVTVSLHNTAPVTIRISSHVHAFEINPRIAFDRIAAWGRRLALSAGATLELAPGATVDADLVPFTGQRVLVGFAGFVDGPLDAPGARDRGLRLLRACGYLDTASAEAADPETAVERRVRQLRRIPEAENAR